MITFHTGNILASEAEALVNTVNCVGVMGRGIALQFKNMFPDNFNAYSQACKAGEVQPGKMFVYTPHQLTNPKFIINFPTKRHWKGNSRMSDIESGLVDLVRTIKQQEIKSIAIPALGSGLGGLNWTEVKLKIVEALTPLIDVNVAVYEPVGAPDCAAIARNTAVPNMTHGRAALVTLMQRYLNGLMDPFVTLLEVHKLMYFMQNAGEPLRLQYAKANYGPYAENLRHVLKAVEGHLVSGYADGGDAPDKRLAIVPGAFEDAEKFLSDKTSTRSRFERVASLVDGFETPFGLELLATVHWVATKENANTVTMAIEQIHCWNEHKKRFSPHQIKIAYSTLERQGWLN